MAAVESLDRIRELIYPTLTMHIRLICGTARSPKHALDEKYDMQKRQDVRL